MPTILTQIVEGPREEDNKVRFLCPTCGETTPWHPMPTFGETVTHKCDHKPQARAQSQGQTTPCAENYLNAALHDLRGALAKSKGEELKTGIQNTIESVPQLLRLAVAEAIEEGQEQ